MTFTLFQLRYQKAYKTLVYSDFFDTISPMTEQFDHLRVENLPVRLANNCQNVGLFIPEFHQDINRLVGRDARELGPLVSEPTFELAQAANVSSLQMERWISSLVTVNPNTGLVEPRPKGNTVMLFHDQLLSYRGINQNWLEEVSHNFSSSLPDHARLIDNLARNHPFAATATYFLYIQAVQGLNNPDAAGENFRRLYWYKEAIDNASDAAKQSGEFFNKLSSRAKKSRVSDLTQRFISDFEEDIFLHTAEAVSLANAFAISILRGSNSGILFGNFPVSPKPLDLEFVRQQILALDRAEVTGSRDPVFKRFSDDIFELNTHAEARGGLLLVPTYLSFIDASSYLNFLKGYWTRLNKGLSETEPHKSSPAGRDQEEVIYLGDEGAVFIRHLMGNKGAQSRIVLQAGGESQGFNLRIDAEQRRKRLTLDIGRATSDDALAYAEFVADEDSKEDFMDKYYGVVDSTGKLKPEGERGGYYPTVWETNASYYTDINRRVDLNEGQKAALTASIIVQDGQNLGIRPDLESYSYHTRGKLHDNPDYFTFYPIIASQIKKSLTDNHRR